jgi:hypothetical protein
LGVTRSLTACVSLQHYCLKPTHFLENLTYIWYHRYSTSWVDSQIIILHYCNTNSRLSQRFQRLILTFTPVIIPKFSPIGTLLLTTNRGPLFITNNHVPHPHVSSVITPLQDGSSRRAAIITHTRLRYCAITCTNSTGARSH